MRAGLLFVPFWLSIALLVPSAWAEAPKTLLLVGQGPDGHPDQTHEYRDGVRIVARLLRDTPDLTILTESGDEPWPQGPELIGQADGVVLFVSQGAKWIHDDPRRLDALGRLTERQGGFVGLHWGIGTQAADYIDGFLRLAGGCHGGPDRKFAVLEADVVPAEHPINAGIAAFRVRDEFYYRLKFTPEAGLTPLWQAEIEGQTETIAWAWERPDGGRSAGFSGLHFHENWRLPAYRRLVAHGVLWSLGLPIPEGGLNVDLTDEELAASSAD